MIASLTNLVSSKRVAAAMVSSVIALCPASGQQREQKPTTIADLRNAIEAVLHETRTPGAGIAIVSREEIEWAAGLGMADVARKRAATAETLFRIGSISKSFAALAALKLQEEGKLKLLDTLKQWLPEVAFENRWESTDPVRLVHLMEHTTGFEDCHLREYAFASPIPARLLEGLAYGARSRVCRWRPGTRMAYCNSGPAVLAAVIEKVSGQRFEDYVQENFFKPLRMDTAGYFLTPEAEHRLSRLYRPDGVTPYPYWQFLFWPSGSINASANDMANFVRFHLQRGSLDGAQLLQPASIARMETTETLPSARLGSIAGYGLYNHAMPEGAFTFRGHGGAIMGALSEMAYLSDAGRGYAVMINSGNGHALLRITKLIRTYLVRDLTPPLLPPSAFVPAELQRHYGGHYQIISPREQWLYAFDRLVALATGLRGAITANEVDDLTPLGTPSALAITIMLSSIAFALATMASLYVLYRERTAAMNRGVYWHSLAVTGGLLGVAIYYGYWGLIGVRLWA